MRKRVLSACLCGMMTVVLLAGCGGKEENPSSEKDTSGSAAEEKKEKLIIGTSSVSVDLAESGVEALEDMGTHGF